jgi:hypothetical protein
MGNQENLPDMGGRLGFGSSADGRYSLTRVMSTSHW